MHKKVLIVNGNPKQQSFCHELADSFVARGHERLDIQRVDLNSLEFDPNLEQGYSPATMAESDIEKFQQYLLWAEHVVFIFPVWWGGMPAKFKGLIDRSFLPGFAYKFGGQSLRPQQLLKGKTASVVITMDTPPWYHRLFQGNSAYTQMKRSILDFCGFSKVSPYYIGPLIRSSEIQRGRWKQQMSALAQKL